MIDGTVMHAKYREIEHPHHDATMPTLGETFYVGFSGGMEDCIDWAENHIKQYSPNYDIQRYRHKSDKNTSYLCPDEIDDNGYGLWIIINKYSQKSTSANTRTWLPA